MAKKRNVAVATPSLPFQRKTPALPIGARPLFLPDLLAQAAANLQVKAEAREAAHAVFRKWARDLAGGVLRSMNEVQVEDQFYNGLLGALGYTSHAVVTTGEPWTMQAKWNLPGIGTPDVALGSFRLDPDGKLAGTPLVMVEVERAGKDLDRKESSGRSPVQQAWDYLNGSETARWAIVSNYEEFRLYSKDRTSRHIYRVSLADLADPDAFAEFYAVVHAGSLLGTGAVNLNAMKLLEATGERQEAVGKKLYDLYSENRAKLIEEFRAGGAADLDRAIQAAQRLLDRILFIAFAEDRDLLGDSRTLEKTASARLAGATSWNSFQYLFRAIDRGDPYHRVPKYNGNLFKPDPILDDLEFNFPIEPERWPAAFKSLGDFDFKHEVTVDVLGRIFERSITDIEQIRAEGLQKHEETLAERRRPGRRKTQGVYYTDAAIVEYLVGAALGPAWERLRAESAAGLGLDPATLADPPPAAFSRRMLAGLDALTVCDPACGSGAFLNAAYDWFEEARLGLLRDLKDAEPDAPECDGDREDWAARSAPIILRHNIYGVDLSPESVEIAQLSLWIRTARRNQPLTDLSANVRCGNSVVADATLDPKAFDWPARFPGPLAAGGFDAVVGNPPYVRQEHLGPIKPHLEASYRAYHGMADLYVYFYEKGMRLLKPGGRLAYVVTNKWLKAGYGEPLRRFFAEESWIESVVDFGHAKQFFKDADVFPCFLVARRPDEGPKPETTRVCVIPRDAVRIDDLNSQIVEYSSDVARGRLDAGPWMLDTEGVYGLLAKIKSKGVPLSEFTGIQPLRGILTGLNEAFLVDNDRRKALISADPTCTEIIKPYLRGQDIKRWSPSWASLWMIAIPSSGDRQWAWTNAGNDAEAIFKQTYPSLYSHMESFRDKLIEREDQGKFWWELRSCGYWAHFDQPKIMFQEMTWQLQWCYDLSNMICNNTAYILATHDLWVLAVVNSPACWWYAWRTAVHGKDEVLRFIKEYVQNIPIPSPTSEVRVASESLMVRLSAIAIQQQTTRRDLLDWLKVQYDIAEPSQKLQAPTGLDSDAFVAEVQKLRGKANPLSSAALRALRDEYARSIEPARALAAEAATLERRVSDLVNEAYGLTPEEVRLMWDTAPPRMPIAPPQTG